MDLLGTSLPKIDNIRRLQEFLAQFKSGGAENLPVTVEAEFGEAGGYPRFTGEFWTARQRQSASIHEISYRACFKAQLPGFFIELLTRPGETVFDPFAGRGTTPIEAGLRGRQVLANDVNPLSQILIYPRFFIPSLPDLKTRLEQIPIDKNARAEVDLSMFYHPETEAELVSLKNYLAERKASGQEDHLDTWIRMVATNRLTGHSTGFFSVYTLPPNQATSPARQRKINERRNQQPEYRDTVRLILKKSATLLSRLTAEQIGNLRLAGKTARIFDRDAAHLPGIPDNSIALTVTSPPFLNIVQYAADNWLRCWFNEIDAEAVSRKITMAADVGRWSEIMQTVFRELYRITRPGGWLAFEVGEVNKGKIRLDEVVAPLGQKAGFRCAAVMINRQKFTKTANIWGVSNNHRGVNSNRIVVFQKPA